jgi:hypothetical protein
MGQAPFEIIAAPFDVYMAPTGSAFPDLSATPGAPWLLIGTNGDKNMTEDGVSVTHDQNIEVFRPVGMTAARKAFRTEENLLIKFTIADVSAEQYALMLNSQTVTDTAAGSGTAGNLNFPLLRGLQVNFRALLIRGNESAEGDGFRTQYEVPMVYQNGNPEVTWKKGEPAMLECEYVALWDVTDGFGFYRSQDAAPL